MKEHLLAKIGNRTGVVGIIGLGYVGLPLAREFLKKNFTILGFDLDGDKIEKINRGKSYIKHISEDFLKEFVLEKKKFSATADFSRLQEADFILICVPTPLDEHYNPDLSYVLNSTEVISKFLKKGHVVVLESTTYPGTTEEEMLPILEKSGLKEGIDFHLGFSPEREDPGNKDFETGNIPKVISAVSNDGLEILKSLYGQIVKVVPVSSPKIAEASKILENTYRAINIALVNELKIIFDRMGIDVWEVIEAAKTKPFGFQAFYPGPGLGGHCIPIDPFYLTWKAKEYDIHTHFIELAGEINNTMPYYVIEKTMKALNVMGRSLVGAKILVVGVAYKPDIDDMRESPALKVIDLLIKEGVDVSYYDPYIPALPKTRKYGLNLASVEIDKLRDGEFDAGIIITNHSAIDYNHILKKTKIMIDTRNALNQKGTKSEKIWKA
ncbi:MAG TPA: nucleotide sugar dehydrogenase [Candidatus Deferrimicrobium sp.]|nr:nucleotide sugar dehydrogenase [Candidatus Deferrimicrobium sp.]